MGLVLLYSVSILRMGVIKVKIISVTKLTFASFGQVFTFTLENALANEIFSFHQGVLLICLFEFSFFVDCLFAESWLKK